MPEWISKATCLKCKKKGHLAFNCPPKYLCKTIKAPPKSNNFNKTTANNVTDSADNSAKFTEFAGMAYSSSPELTCRPFNKCRYTRNFYHHKQRINMLSKIPASNRMKETFNHSLFKEARCHSLYKTITNKIYNLPNYEQSTVRWLLNALQEDKIRHTSNHRVKNYNRPYKHKRDIAIMTTPPHSNKTRRCGNYVDKNSTNAFNVEHEILAKNHFPASDLEKGWVIDSGASAHMTPFTKDCRDIQPAQIGRAHV